MTQTTPSKVALITGVTGQDGAYLSELLINIAYDANGANALRTYLQCAKQRLTSGCLTVVDNKCPGLLKGHRVVRNRAPWTPLHSSNLTSLQFWEIAR